MPLFDRFLNEHVERTASFISFLGTEHPHECANVHHSHSRHDFLGDVGSEDLAVDTAHEASSTGHSDFLFGSPVSNTGLGSSRTSTALISPDKLVPKMSMMANATEFYNAVAPQAAMVAEHIWKNMPRLDPFTDGKEDKVEQSGWCRAIPRGLRVFLAADVISGLILANSIFTPCDVPLKIWHLGNILLGFPLSYLVNNVAKKRPEYQWYRLVATRLRDGSDVKTMHPLDGILLFDQFGNAIHKSETEERHENKHWFVSLKFDRKELITGYKLVTATRGQPGKDPVEWTFEGSVDGVDWVVIDTRTQADVPTGRGVESEMMVDLDHLEWASGWFRKAFLVDLAGSAAAFAWLVAGTTWVSLGTETCVDSAPWLWYPSYFMAVISWSILGTFTIGLIVSAVLMVALNKSN